MATEPDKTDSGALGTILAVLTFGVLFSALGITALVRAASNETRDGRALKNEEFSELRGAQEADLHLPAAYIDEKAGVVRLPIDRAMQVVVRDLQNNPWSATAEKPEDEEVKAVDEAAADDTVAGEAAEGESAEGEAGGVEANGDSGDEETADDTDAKAPEAPKPPKAPAKPKPAVKPPAPKPAPAPRAPAPQPQPAPQAPAPAPAPAEPATP